MADRYDDALRDLAQVPAPDQWDEAMWRAGEAQGPEHEDAARGGDAEDQDRVIPLLPPGPRRSRPQRRGFAAVAAVLALALAGGVVAYLVRSDDSSDTTTTVDEPDPVPEPTAPDQGPRPTTEPTVTEPPATTTTTTAPAREDEPEADPTDTRPGTGTAAPDTGAPEGPAPGTVPEPPAGDEVAGCDVLEFAAPGAPGDLPSVQQDAAAGDPRLHEAAHPYLVGAFDSGGDRAVFVLDVVQFGEDGGRYLQHPLYGEVWLAHNGEPAGSAGADGLVELFVELNGEDCPVTFWGVGLSEGELESFALSLQLAH